MLQKFRKTARDLLPSNKVGHTVFACGLSLLLLTGCGATHKNSLSPLPSEIQSITESGPSKIRTLKAIEGLAKGVPFAVISFKDYKQAKQLIDNHNKRFKGKEDSFEAADAEIKVAVQYKETILSSSKDLFGNPVVGTQFAENFSRADFYSLNKVSRRAGVITGPSALNYSKDYPATPSSLILLPNADNPLDNDEYMKATFNNRLGFKVLSKYLPLKFIKAFNEHILGHEIVHVAQKHKRRGVFGPDLRALNDEIDSDLTSSKLMHQKYNDPSLIETKMYRSALSSVITGDVDHATQFELYKFYKEVKPSAKETPVVEVEDLHRAMRGVWPKRARHTVALYEEALLEENANFPRDPDSKEYGLAMENRKRVLKESYDAGLIQNPQSRALAKFAIEADKYFQGFIDRGQKQEQKLAAKPKAALTL